MKNSEHPVAIFVVRIGLRVRERIMTLKKVQTQRKSICPFTILSDTNPSKTMAKVVTVSIWKLLILFNSF